MQVSSTTKITTTIKSTTTKKTSELVNISTLPSVLKKPESNIKWGENRHISSITMNAKNSTQAFYNNTRKDSSPVPVYKPAFTNITLVLENNESLEEYSTTKKSVGIPTKPIKAGSSMYANNTVPTQRNKTQLSHIESKPSSPTSYRRNYYERQESTHVQSLNSTTKARAKNVEVHSTSSSTTAASMRKDALASSLSTTAKKNETKSFHSNSSLNRGAVLQHKFSRCPPTKSKVLQSWEWDSRETSFFDSISTSFACPATVSYVYTQLCKCCFMVIL